MWKYVSRRVRDTFERSANHFDRRSTTNVVNSSVPEEKNKRSGPPCHWFLSRKCWNSFRGENDTKKEKWNFEHLNRSWLGAITWVRTSIIQSYDTFTSIISGINSLLTFTEQCTCARMVHKSNATHEVEALHERCY